MFNYEVKVFPFSGQGKTVAFASVVVENIMEVTGFKVIDGAKGLFVSGPQKKGSKPHPETGKDQYFDDVRWIGDKPEGTWRTPEQDEVFKAIVDAYQAKNTNSSRGAAATAQANGVNADSDESVW